MLDEFGAESGAKLYEEQEKTLAVLIGNTKNKSKNQMKTLIQTILPRVALYKALMNGADKALDRAAERREKRLFVPINCGRDVHRVDLHRVLYGEARNHGVEIYLKSGVTLNTRMTLTDIKNLFAPTDGFISVGASYIVNLRCVQSFLQSDLLMTNGKSVPVPRRLRNSVREQYFEFYCREATKK